MSSMKLSFRVYSNIIVVDDGSKKTIHKKRAQQAGVIALRQRLNRGKGAATKTGIEAAKLSERILSSHSTAMDSTIHTTYLPSSVLILQNRFDVVSVLRLIRKACPNTKSYITRSAICLSGTSTDSM